MNIEFHTVPHKHCCPNCSTIWQHESIFLGSNFSQAHICPICETETWLEYNGHTEPDYVDPHLEETKEHGAS